MEQEPSMMDSLKKKVFVETWGCQMNVADSETMLSILGGQNYEPTTQVEQADLVLLNTCHIREKATHKVLSRLGALGAMTTLRPQVKIAVAGCVAQAEGEKLLSKASNIDILLGPGKINELPDLLARHVPGKAAVTALGFNKPDDQVSTENQELKPTLSGRDEVSRYVNIAQGCDNFCTFCVVPFTRGREISRPIKEILVELQNLVNDGASEITLLGQNVNSYGQDLVRDAKMQSSPDGPFVDLLEASLQLPGLERLRFTTSNPHDFTRPIAELFRKYPKLGRYIHLPVQSGNDQVLERMKRKVTVAEYWERVQWLRDVDPEMALSTDLIVGFPGETEEQFADTLKLVAAVGYSFIYAFKYSPRKGTAANRFRDQVPEDVKSSRFAALKELQDSTTTALNLAEIGRIRTVLCHYKSRKEPDVYYGRTEQFRLVKVPSSRNLQGKLFQVEIVDANKTALVGKILS